jgi:hypothetical protein
VLIPSSNSTLAIPNSYSSENLTLFSASSLLCSSYCDDLFIESSSFSTLMKAVRVSPRICPSWSYNLNWRITKSSSSTWAGNLREMERSLYSLGYNCSFKGIDSTVIGGLAYTIRSSIPDDHKLFDWFWIVHVRIPFWLGFICKKISEGVKHLAWELSSDWLSYWLKKCLIFESII